MNNTSTQTNSDLDNVKDMEGRKYKCPVCGYYTLDESLGNEICPVCFWEDDCREEYADEESPANGISISRARENWHRVGACDPDVLRFCRKPLPSEMIEINEHETDGRD